MVITPWGPADALRARRLPPGPGRSPQEVADNQRERLFGAMVASVVRRGFATTRVSDLTELSGVSSKSFYELFPDKHACFLATVEALTATVPEDADAIAFARWVAEHPAAAKVCLAEAHGGGPQVRERLEATVAAFEARALEASSQRGSDYPPEMVTAYVGALLEIARQRLQRGTEAELPALFEQLDTHLVECYPPPSGPLRVKGRRYARGEEPLDATEARAKARMKSSGAPLIEVRHVLAMFEMPVVAPGEEEERRSGGALGEQGAAGEGPVEP